MNRLILVTPRLIRTDGQGRINLEAARGLAGSGWRVDVVARACDPDIAATAGVTWHRVRVGRALGCVALVRAEAFARRAGRVVDRLRRADPAALLLANGCCVRRAADVNVAMFVHADWRGHPLHPARRVGGLWGRYQQFYTAVNARLERPAFASAGVVVALSPPVREALLREHPIDPERVRVVAPGVDADEFRPLRDDEPNDLRRLAGCGEGDVLACFAGDIKSNRKNLGGVLRALAECPPTVRLAVIGDAAGSRYPTEARRLGVAGRVSFLGRRGDVPGLMRGADVFAFPSHYDTYGLVVTEALASGVPAVVGPEVGAAMAVRDGENGFLLSRSDDHAGLVAALRALDGDRDRLAAMKRAARQSAEPMTWAAMAQEYRRILEHLLDERPRPAAAPAAAAALRATPAATTGATWPT